MIARLALAAAMFALPAAAMAQSADSRPCITPEQNEAVTAYVMPSLATEMARKCAPSLGQGSYLVSNAQRLSQKWQAGADRAWPTARNVVTKLAGIPLAPGSSGDGFAKMVLAPALAGKIAFELDAQACAVTDRLLQQLEPFPAKNLASALATLLEVGAANQSQIPYRVCREQAN